MAVRYPRGSGAGRRDRQGDDARSRGKGELRRQGKQRIAILAFGTPLLAPGAGGGRQIDATVANMRFAKPLDVALVTELARSHDAIVTVEEGCLMAAPAARWPRRWPRPGCRRRC